MKPIHDTATLMTHQTTHAAMPADQGEIQSVLCVPQCVSTAVDWVQSGCLFHVRLVVNSTLTFGERQNSLKPLTILSETLNGLQLEA